ncbi:MAG TPA: hypothetical protein VIK18_15890 [Pirellulales bacterium]
MPRKKREEGEAFGSDSFLDIVANMVGILIILVIVAGLRARRADNGAAVDNTALAGQVESLAIETRNLEGEVLNLSKEIEAIQETDSLRHLERDTLAFAVAACQRDLDERRKTLDVHAREQYDLTRALAQAEDGLELATTELARSVNVVPEAVNKIETYPTPISRTVLGREIHFQLKGGRVTLVPMEELVKLFEIDAQDKIERLRHQATIVETIGPLDGFWLRYTLERIDVPMPGGATASRLAYGFKLYPASPDLGETCDDALRSGSQCRTALAKLPTSGTTVTLWTYPDSFAAFRALKKDLYLLGFSVAGRPMPENQAIGASPNGSKSSAE